MCETCKWDDFLLDCDNLQERIEMIDVDSDGWRDFSSGVMEKLLSMKKWTEDNEHVTEKMKTALGNMDDGVARWER